MMKWQELQQLVNLIANFLPKRSARFRELHEHPEKPNLMSACYFRKKLDNLSLQISQNTPQRDRRPNRDNGEADRNRNLVVQLRRENQDLREILEMEKILSTWDRCEWRQSEHFIKSFFYFRNTEKEIEQLKVDVRERNDLINSLQIQNDNLVEESFMREPVRRVPTDNLLDLWVMENQLPHAINNRMPDNEPAATWFIFLNYLFALSLCCFNKL